MTPEGRTKRKVSALLKSYGDRCYYYMPVPMGFGMRTLDYLGCFCGRFFAIETKAPGEKPTALQANTIFEIRKAGGTTFVIDGEESLKALEEWLVCLSHATTSKS